MVVTNAVTIIMNNGIDAILVSNPSNTSVPHITSNVPVKYAQNPGFVKPILRNLPVPSSSGNKNFWIPSERKINPTTSLISIILLSLRVLKIKIVKRCFEFIILK